MPDMKIKNKESKRDRLRRHGSDRVQGKAPLLCPPESVARRLPYRIAGYLCRVLVIWVATGGLAVFLSGAMMYDVPNGYLMGVSLVCVGLISLFCLGWKTAIIGGVCTAGLTVWQCIVHAELLPELRYAPLALYNGCLRRLETAGYLTFSSMSVSYSSAASEEQLLRAGMAGVILLFALVYTLCLLRRANLLPPAIMSTAVLTVLMTFNVYSNRIQSNLGIVLVIVSFAAVLVMAACDRVYRPVAGHRRGAAEELLPPEQDGQRPTLPESYIRKRQLRAERRARRRTRQVRTVDEELNDYFAGSKTRKAVQDAGKTDDGQSVRAQVRAVRTYDRITDHARGAAGGFTAVVALLICLLAVALPAILIRGNFTTIEPLDEKLSFARDYVTAVLRGDDSRLDELAYQADRAHFTPRSTELEQLSFTGRQILYVKARYSTNYYLPGWIGTDYRDGAWQAVDNETRASYRRLFGTDTSPAETLRYNFYHYTKPSLVDSETSAEQLLESYGGNRSYGFLTVLLHMRRINSPGSEALLPAVYAPSFGLSEYNTALASKLGIVNYFDGIRTGRDFKENGVSYASVAYAPIMSSIMWVSNTAELAEMWALGREAVLIQMHLPGTEGTNLLPNSLLNLTVAEENGTTVFNFTYNVRKGVPESSFRFYHPTSNVRWAGSSYIITERTGTLTITASAGKVLAVALVSKDDDTERPNLLEQYNRLMTDSERAALAEALTAERAYSDFVYSTYTATGGSAYIADLAATVRKNAHRWMVAITNDTTDTSAADNNLCAEYPDVSFAGYRDLSALQAFSHRDSLVRCVIDYIIRDLGCTYTITPDLSGVDASLDGVENFLRNTKQGYCVQFASAAALILREYGIPVRYVEGYIATNLQKAGKADFVYGGYVHDYEAHAWIEVYFDGVGWIQYETTPQYYTGLYGFLDAISDQSVPVVPSPSESDSSWADESNSEPVTTGNESATEPDTGDISISATDTDIGNDGDPASRRAAGIAMLILFGIALAIGLLSVVIRRARDAQYRRRDLAERVLALERDPEEPRELAQALCDNVTDLLALFGLSPGIGEFPDAYAARLTAALTPGTKDAEPAERIPPIRPILDALAAEEFGNGMTTIEMKQMAQLYLFLHAHRARFLRPGTRLWLHYVRRRI